MGLDLADPWDSAVSRIDVTGLQPLTEWMLTSWGLTVAGDGDLEATRKSSGFDVTRLQLLTEWMLALWGLTVAGDGDLEATRKVQHVHNGLGNSAKIPNSLPDSTSLDYIPDRVDRDIDIMGPGLTVTGNRDLETTGRDLRFCEVHYNSLESWFSFHDL
ncbi:hypothetical protein OS493_004670 [Desmophyllum pertusum]|uniref:Uncharacterized protein n=1 Tax=Desmophyllum pertusum TaxID=174260 RepID=A0A9X0CYY3_9CNID|nr:hypothetical protein OS493_004670 [Desmophyllum pertusum]